MKITRNTAINIASAVVIVFTLIIFAVYIVSTNKSDDPNVAEDTKIVAGSDVSPDTMDRMSRGSILTFGDPTKKQLTLIVDPEELSRNGSLVGSKPSPLMNAVKDGDIALNLYLAPRSDNRAVGVNSIVKAAVCKLSQDKSKTGIYTLTGIVKTADSVSSISSTEEAGHIMGIKNDDKCPANSNEVAVSTSNNAQHFMTQFEMDSPGAIVSGGGLTRNIRSLDDDWVKKAIDGTDARSMVSGVK